MGCGSSAAAANNNINNNMVMMRNHSNILRSDKERVPIQINSESLQNYLELEYSIHEYEKKHAMENFQIKGEQLGQIEQAAEQLEEEKKLIYQETNEWQNKLGIMDLNSVKDFISRKNANELFSIEEEKLLDSLNRQEIIEKELEETMQLRNNLKQEIEQLTMEGGKLQRLYQQRDELLDAVFEGQYGSDIENQLEKELDWLMDQKHHVDQAFFRWKQAVEMTKQATSLLGVSIHKWKELLDIPIEEKEKRYFCAVEARDNLLAASQNIQGAQRYLPNISLPYCAPDELETLNKAISYIFTDMQTPERHAHALNCYQTTYKRAGALRQWLEQVLNSTIGRDLHELGEECKSRASDLRSERIRLIKKRVRDITGRDIDFEDGTPIDLRVDSGVDSELDDSAAADEQIAQIFEAGRSERNGVTLTPDPTRMPLIMPTPLPSADLPPMPTNDEIFGKIEQLREKHRREISDFQKAQKLNQARMTSGLKSKLQARRSRRSRMEMHRRELEALRESPT